MTSIDSGDIKWLAGLLEGEGCFRNSQDGGMSIRLKMTDRDVVERAASLMRPPSIMEEKHENPKHKTGYLFQVGGTKAAGWMMTLYSLMGKRRKTAILNAINKWRSTLPEARFRTACPKGHPYDRKAPGKNGRPQRLCRICANEQSRIYGKRHYEEIRIKWRERYGPARAAKRRAMQDPYTISLFSGVQ